MKIQLNVFVFIDVSIKSLMFYKKWYMCLSNKIAKPYSYLKMKMLESMYHVTNINH